MSTKYLISQKKLKSLYKELKYWEEEIINVKRKMGESTSIDNDLRENSEYLQLTQDLQYKIPTKINEINILINDCNLLDENYFSFRNTSESVSIFDEIILEDENAKIYKYIIVGFNESDINKNWISYKAPIISKVFNKKEGYVFEFNNIEYELIQIEKKENSYVKYVFE